MKRLLLAVLSAAACAKSASLPVNVTRSPKQMRPMRPALLRQRARLKGSKKLVHLNFS